MLGCWVARTIVSLTKGLMFQVLFTYGLRALKTLYFYFCKIIKNENELKGFLQRILQEIMEKNNTWNTRPLVDESFVPLTQWPTVLYWRLSDFITYTHRRDVKSDGSRCAWNCYFDQKEMAAINNSREVLLYNKCRI